MWLAVVIGIWLTVEFLTYISNPELWNKEAKQEVVKNHEIKPHPSKRMAA